MSLFTRFVFFQGCASCKSFFRRNFLKHENLKCFEVIKCKMNQITRRWCPKCRLDKCFQVGMKAEIIYSRMKPKVSQIDSFLELAIKSYLSESFFPSINQPNETNYFQLNPYLLELNSFEKCLLKEISTATEISGFDEEESIGVSGECTDFFTALNFAENYIRKTIKFCKNITAFKNLNQNDQLIILKCFFSEMMLIRITFVFKPELAVLPAIKDEQTNERVFVNFNLMNNSSKKDWTFYLLQKCHYMHTELENDPMIRDLIITILLFQPRKNLSCPEFIKYNYNVYYYLGNRYLEHKYGDVQKAMDKVNKFMELKTELEFFKEIFESFFIEDATELPMILSELFTK